MTSLAQNREQHMQRFHDQLTAWQEDINRLRAKAFTANSRIQGEMNRLVTQLDKRIEQLTQRLMQVAEKGDVRVYATLESMESAWGSLRNGVNDMMERMRDRRDEASDRIGEAVEKGSAALERSADAVEDTVKRGANKARQAMESQGQGDSGGGSQTTVSAQAGRRPAAGADLNEQGGQEQGRTQGVGASVTVTRTRNQH